MTTIAKRGKIDALVRTVYDQYKKIRSTPARAMMWVDTAVLPLTSIALANAAYLKAVDMGIEQVIRHTDDHQTAAVNATYLAAVAAGYQLNKRVILPLAQKFYGVMREERKKTAAKKELPNVNRRHFLTTLGSVGAATAASYIGGSWDATKKISADFENALNALGGGRAEPILTDNPAIPIIPNYKDGVETRYGNVIVEPGALSGYTIPAKSLFSKYTGLSGRVNGRQEVNFNGILANLWDEKKRRFAPGPTEAKPVFFSVADTLQKEYAQNKHHHMTLNEYVASARQSINEVRDNIQWDSVASIKNMGGSKIALLQSIANTITGKDMIAYGLTELMPSERAPLNLWTLDYLLRNAGREFVESMPSLWDNLTSFGPYQFTQYAVFHTKDRIDGASIMNRALPRAHRIPGSVSMLRGNQHHKTAYLFALNNIANMINRCSPTQFDALNYAWKAQPKTVQDNLMKFVAVSHHAPADASSYAMNWINRLERNPHVDFDDFISNKSTRTEQRHKTYSKKTALNRAALYDGVWKIPNLSTELRSDTNFKQLYE